MNSHSMYDSDITKQSHFKSLCGPIIINTSETVVSSHKRHNIDIERSNVKSNIFRCFQKIYLQFISNKYLEHCEITSINLILWKTWNFLFISTYDELGSMGVDFGRLLENQTKADEITSRPPSASASRSNSRTASITSLSSFMTNDTSKQEEPDEVILTFLTYFMK